MNRKNLEMLLRNHEAEVYRFVKYLGADHSLAEDLAQETFLAAFRSGNPPPMADARRRGAWLRGIARTIFLAHCRKQKASPLVVNSQVLEQAEAYWAANYRGDGDLSARAAALQECLKQTSERQRRLVDLRYRENRSRAEMAKALSLNEEGVKTALRRLRASLAKCIRARLEQESG